jgi:hypothetical protein
MVPVSMTQDQKRGQTPLAGGDGGAVMAGAKRACACIKLPQAMVPSLAMAQQPDTMRLEAKTADIKIEIDGTMIGNWQPGPCRSARIARAIRSLKCQITAYRLLARSH